MGFTVMSGSGTRKPLSPREQTKRLQELRVINWSPREPYQLAWRAIDPDKETGSYIFRFKFGLMEMGAIVTIRVVFGDVQSGAEVVITNMTTLPDAVCGQGYGTQALQMLLEAIKKKGLKNIQAVQVQRDSERFWTKNGFVALKNATNDFQYVQPSDSG